MSGDTESTMSSGVYVFGVESLLDDGSTMGVGEAKRSIKGNSANALFDLGDGDMYIKVRH